MLRLSLCNDNSLCNDGNVKYLFAPLLRSIVIKQLMSDITIVFGTETGNSESLAKMTSKRLQSQGHQVLVMDLEEFSVDKLLQVKHLLVITSTYGEGEPPANAEEFYDDLMSDDAPNLSHLSFSVCALGDQDYDLFCQCGKDIDERLQELGASRFAARVDCDADYLEFEDWWHGVEVGLKKMVPPSSTAPQQSASQQSAPQQSAPQQFAPQQSAPQQSAPQQSAPQQSAPQQSAPQQSAPRLSPLALGLNPSPPQKKIVESTVRTDMASLSSGQRSQNLPIGVKKRPYFAEIIENYNLNHVDSEKETRHISFSLESCETDYQVGDALGVYPRNDSDLINEIIHYGGLNRDERLLYDGEYLNLFYILKYKLDIVKIDPRLIELLSPHLIPAQLKGIISDRKALKTFIDEHHIIDLFRSGYLQPSATDLVKALRALSPRLYSISSSPLAHPGKVHLTVDVLRYELYGSTRKGVASNFLGDAEVGSYASVYVHPTRDFKLCEPDKPIIMIGPGTGIAPFKAMLEEREATRSPGKSWLFFGAQRSNYDFLYKESLEKWVQSGVISQLNCAWSRDQEQKVYVQDLMYQHSVGIWAWMEAGAYIYICGDAKRMAKDVHQTLLRIIREQGQMSEEAAEEYMGRVKSEKRYLRDVY